jgi:multiple sugar transport system substrate-binding protein
MAEVRFLGCDNDVFCRNVQDRAQEFEQASGHKLTVQLLDNDFYYANKLTDYLGGQSPADVYMSGPVLVWEQLGLGFVRPLDEFAGRASESFDLSDFFDRLIGGNRWSGHFGDQLGHGPLLAIPVNWESYNLAYLPEILTQAGVEVPRTWPEYFAAAKAIPAQVPAARGFGQRGAEAWHTVYTGFATQLWSCGGRDFDPDGSCAIASAAALEAARTLSDAIRVAGPRRLEQPGLVRTGHGLRPRQVRAAGGLRPLRRVFRELSSFRRGGKGTVCPPTRGPGRHQAPEYVDVVHGHERSVRRA